MEELTPETKVGVMKRFEALGKESTAKLSDMLLKDPANYFLITWNFVSFASAKNASIDCSQAEVIKNVPILELFYILFTTSD